MYVTEFKVFTLKKRVLFGDALKGIIALINCSKKLKFNINYLYLKDYILDLDRISSFESLDELYHDMFKTFVPTSEMLNKIKIKSYINKELSKIIDVSLSNQNLSSNFLEYIYSYFLEEFIDYFLDSDFSKEDKIELIFDIPVDNIDLIYSNYYDLDIEEKIEKFKHELIIFSMYSHIGALTEESFVIVDLDEEETNEEAEQVLLIEFKVINKIA